LVAGASGGSDRPGGRAAGGLGLSSLGIAGD
jgi:hypothetical protein